jgi:hypothetical protein
MYEFELDESVPSLYIFNPSFTIHASVIGAPQFVPGEQCGEKQSARMFCGESYSSTGFSLCETQNVHKYTLLVSFLFFSSPSFDSHLCIPRQNLDTLSSLERFLAAMFLILTL